MHGTILVISAWFGGDALVDNTPYYSLFSFCVLFAQVGHFASLFNQSHSRNFRDEQQQRLVYASTIDHLY
jgi:hypothetical protein